MADNSRNSWIKQDDPTMVSSKNKDGYKDILDKMRGTNNIELMTKTYNPPIYKYNESRTPYDLNTSVMNSDRVCYAIDQECKLSNRPLPEVKKEAQEILTEMAHNLTVNLTRAFSFCLAKIFKSLHSRIYVNDEGINRTRELIKEYPVLFMPTHRSYLDFLLISYLCFDYDLPLPSIASAMDFMGMKLIGSLFRRCGAFFIRRSFSSDALYWAVFTEYVQSQLHNGDYPVEFFVEGTRSRTSKSYYPKIGMLSVVLEPYFKARVPDIMIVPISISYDRVLEETLYAYELLGVPKPRESTSGLIKARNVLSEDFGSVYIHFTQPISIRHFSSGRIDRISHSLTPRYVAGFTNDETELVKNLAQYIVRTQQTGLVISPWSIIASILVQNLDTGIYVFQLVKEAEWLRQQTESLGAYVNWPVNDSAENVIRSHLHLHKNIVTVNDHDLVQLSIPSANIPSNTDQLMQHAAQNLMLAMYRNQLTHVFVRVALVSLIISANKEPTVLLETVYLQYQFLERVLCHDFIFLHEQSRQDFDKAVATLTHTGNLVVNDGVVDVKRSINKYTTFLTRMFEPFLLAYWVLAQYMLSMANDVHGKPLAKLSKTIIKEAQSLAATLLRDNSVQCYEILSLDVLTNGLLSFIDMGAVSKEKRAGQNYLFGNAIFLSKITEDIGKLTEVPVLHNKRINLAKQTVTINSKL